MIAFRVLGHPAPQGSKSRMPNGAIVEGRSTGQRVKHKAWRSAVADTARDHLDPAGPLDGPLFLQITFRMPRPKAAKQRHWCISRTGDLDKLIRSSCDALTDAGIIVDDALIAELRAAKVYADPTDPWTGADITISQLGVVAA